MDFMDFMDFFISSTFLCNDYDGFIIAEKGDIFNASEIIYRCFAKERLPLKSSTDAPAKNKKTVMMQFANSASGEESLVRIKNHV